MQALVVVDAQNEFSPEGLRAVHKHAEALKRILQLAKEARLEKRPIAWCKHYNKPHEARAFVPKTWGAEFSPGIGPEPGHGPEMVFKKDLHGAFTFTGLQEWLQSLGVDELLVTGFSTHMCVSTTAREGISRGFKVSVDYRGTATCGIEHPVLGSMCAEEVRRTSLLHLANIGIEIVGFEPDYDDIDLSMPGQAEQISRI